MNILTIDMNCIFYSCIKLYADRVNQNENATIIWDRLDNEFNMSKFLDYDSKLLLKLANIIKANKKAPVYLVEEQKEIVELIRPYFSNNEESETMEINIINIDFFDDIHLIGQSKANIRRFDKYDSYDWLGYLLYKKYVSNVTWYKAANSTMCPSEYGFDYKIKSFFELDLEDNKDFESIDGIIISYSPKFVPYKYKHLADLLKLIGGK